MNIATVKGLMSLACIGLLFATSVPAKVTLNLSAKISVAPCTVSPVLVAGQPVSLGILSSADFQSSGSVAEKWNDFTLALSNCPPGTSRVTAKFGGTRDSNEISLFANTASNDPASNMAVQVSKQSNHSELISHNSSMIANVDAATGSAVFPLSARMKSPLGKAVRGNVSTVMTVDFTYQ